MSFNRGFNFSRIESVENNRPVYKTSGYVKKGRKDMNNYTPDEIKIIGQMVIDGVYKYSQAVSRLLIESEKGNTILNEGTFQLLWRVRQERGVVGVRHWMNHVKPLKYYLDTPVSVLLKEINKEAI